MECLVNNVYLCQKMEDADSKNRVNYSKVIKELEGMYDKQEKYDKDLIEGDEIPQSTDEEQEKEI
jgi:hypothetical protein